MTDRTKLREYFKIILEYEFESHSYGMQQSDFTNDIIKCESSRLAKSRKIDTDKACVITKSSKRWMTKTFDTVQEAIEYSRGIISEAYIAYENLVITKVYMQDKFIEELIGVI